MTRALALVVLWASISPADAGLLRRIATDLKKKAAEVTSSVGRAASSALPASRGGLLAALQEKISLARTVLEVARDYPRKRAELRALRAKPAPAWTGFDPVLALSGPGLANLARKAEAYERMTTERHLLDHLLVKYVALHPGTGARLRYQGGHGDGSYHNGQYLAARAYKYGVTGDPRDLAALRSAMTGVYHLMTIAAAPAGRIVNPRTGAAVAPRPGLAVRGFVDEDASVHIQDEGRNFDLASERVWRYEGTLAGLSGRRFLLIADVSRDQMDGLMFGVAAAAEVLTRRNVEPEGRRLLGAAAATFARDFVSRGYRIVDLNGRVTTYGDQSNLLDPTTLVQNLSWLKTAWLASGAPDVKAAYDALAGKYLGGPRADLWAAGLESLARPMLRDHIEVVQYVVADFNYNLVMLSLFPLARHEADHHLRRAYHRYLEALARPLVADLRVPFFDFLYLALTGKRDERLRGRAAAVLRQYREPPFPFGNPASQGELVTDFSGRSDLRDPLRDYFRDVWDRDVRRRIAGRENPFEAGGGIWPLGPGFVPRDHNIERANPYRLRGSDPYADGTTDGKRNLKEFAGHDYLLSYWFARYHGLL
jgi:hypothetical protein